MFWFDSNSLNKGANYAYVAKGRIAFNVFLETWSSNLTS